MSKYEVSADGMVLTVTDNSDEVMRALDSAIKTALDVMGAQAEGYAKQNLAESMSRISQPTWARTGRLMNNINHKVLMSEKAVYIGTNVDYAPYVEYGTGIHATNGQGRPTPWAWYDDKGDRHWTHGMKPRHFLRNAASNHVAEYRSILKNVLKG